MTKIVDIQQELLLTEQLTIQDMLNLKGGAKTDDKRRMRPGGTTVPSCKTNG